MISFESVPCLWGITGNLGGGKSLTAASLAYVAFSRGFYVVSNITLNIDVISNNLGFDCSSLYQHFSFDADFDPFLLPCGDPRGSGGKRRVVVIMDECAEWLDQYSSAQNPLIKRFWSWIRHSSKRSQDVILIIQRLDYLNKVLRLLVNRWVICDDLRVWRAPVIKIRVPFMGGFCMQRVFNNHNQLIQGPFVVSKQKFGKYYNTAECLNTDGAQYNNIYKLPLNLRLPHYAPALLFYFLSFILLVVAYNKYCNLAPRGVPVAPHGAALPCLYIP